MVILLEKAALQFPNCRSTYTKQYKQTCTLNIEVLSWNGNGDEKTVVGGGMAQKHHLGKYTITIYLEAR